MLSHGEDRVRRVVISGTEVVSPLGIGVERAGDPGA
jgi:hypothetical protein